MLEAKLEEAAVLKRLLDGKGILSITSATRLTKNVLIAIKELVNDANFECNEEGIVSVF